MFTLLKECFTLLLTSLDKLNESIRRTGDSDEAVAEPLRDISYSLTPLNAKELATKFADVLANLGDETTYNNHKVDLFIVNAGWLFAEGWRRNREGLDALGEPRFDEEVA